MKRHLWVGIARAHHVFGHAGYQSGGFIADIIRVDPFIVERLRVPDSAADRSDRLHRITVRHHEARVGIDLDQRVGPGRVGRPFERPVARRVGLHQLQRPAVVAIARLHVGFVEQPFEIIRHLCGNQPDIGFEIPRHREHAFGRLVAMFHMVPLVEITRIEGGVDLRDTLGDPRVAVQLARARRRKLVVGFPVPVDPAGGIVAEDVE